jgi:hypothetical protein
MQTLKKLTPTEAKKLITDKYLLNRILNKKEKAFILTGKIKHKKIEPTLDIELAIYKCERVGFFDKD